jgi:uncharacterized protein (UPF0276 family)
MSSIIHTFGAGFNPCYLTRELPKPDKCTYIEAGNNFLHNQDAFATFVCSDTDFSLHLGRVPFCETAEIQSQFVIDITHNLRKEVTSIGLHLCGAYQQGLGLLGLGSDFIPSTATEATSRQLMELLLSTTDRQILLENANFYDHKPQQAIETIQFANTLCMEYGVGLILDLAHLIMNAHNLGIEPYYLLGQVNLEAVKVIHLSGIVEDSNGIFHDGHTQPVHPSVWSMLTKILPLLSHPVKIVLEHNDACWANQIDNFLADWQYLEQVVTHTQNSPDSPREIDINRIGIGYLANIILPQYFPHIYTALGQHLFTDLVKNWGTDVTERIASQPNVYVTLGKVNYLDKSKNCLNLIADFSDFLQKF